MKIKTFKHCCDTDKMDKDVNDFMQGLDVKHVYVSVLPPSYSNNVHYIVHTICYEDH